MGKNTQKKAFFLGCIMMYPIFYNNPISLNFQQWEFLMWYKIPPEKPVDFFLRTNFNQSNPRCHSSTQWFSSLGCGAWTEQIQASWVGWIPLEISEVECVENRLSQSPKMRNKIRRSGVITFFLSLWSDFWIAWTVSVSEIKQTHQARLKEKPSILVKWLRFADFSSSKNMISLPTCNFLQTCN